MGAVVVLGSLPPRRPVGPAVRVAVPGAGAVKAVPPRCAGCAIAERWTVAPGAVPELSLIHISERAGK
ncbi:hypothetical protein, partial [Streptomyces sp. rh195]|uniref:hypothetical protein n=1 Tax=Streptomyces sp. rh195 TaxID=2034271 RepID=UPI001C54DBFA